MQCLTKNVYNANKISCYGPFVVLWEVNNFVSLHLVKYLMVLGKNLLIFL